MSDKAYFGLFDSREDVAKEFGVELPEDIEILFATYEYECYSGSAEVIFRDANGDLYLVEGSHCSCYGLENQWSPDLVLPDQLCARMPSDLSGEAKTRYRELWPYQELPK